MRLLLSLQVHSEEEKPRLMSPPIYSIDGTRVILHLARGLSSMLKMIRVTEGKDLIYDLREWEVLELLAWNQGVQTL